jgi:hypothetical protein
MNAGPIPRLCRYNWPGLQVYPKLRHSHIRTVLRLEPVLEALAHLVAGTLLTPDLETENRVRQLLDLPELPERPVPPPAPDPADDDDQPPERDPDDQEANQDPTPGKQAHTAPRTFAGARTCSHPPLDFADARTAAIGELFERTNDTFQRTAGKLLGDMITKLQTAAATALRKVDKPFSRARLYAALQALELPGQERYAAALRDYLTALADAGRQAAAEVAGGAVPAASADERNHIKAQADLLARRHTSEIKAAFLQQLLSGALTQVPPDQAVADAAQSARDRLTADFSSWLRPAAVALVAELSRTLPSEEAAP